MKQLVKNYSFSVSSKQVTLTDFASIRLDRLLLIIDVTTNKILYNFADNTVTTASVSGNVVTLAALQGGEANGDSLQIIYDTLTGDPVYGASQYVADPSGLGQQVGAGTNAMPMPVSTPSGVLARIVNPVTVASGVTVTSTSGTLNAHIDNWPTTQHTFVDNSLNVASLPNITAASGLQNVHVDNWPTTQHVYADNLPNITLSGVQHTAVDNFPSGIAVNQVQGTVTVSGIVANPPGEVLSRVVNPVTIASGVAVSSVVAASGVQNVHVDNWPSTQGVFVNNPLNVASLPAVTSVSGTLNAHIDNWPSVQHAFVENLTTLTTSGIQHTLIDNFPTGIAVNQVQGIVSVSGLVTNTPGVTTAVSGTVTATSGTLNTHVDNWPSTQGVFVQNPITSVSGSHSVHVDNWPNVQHVYVENSSGTASNVDIFDSSGNSLSSTGGSLNVNVTGGGAGGGVAQTQVRDQQNNWHDVGFQTSNAMMPVTVSGTTASGINHTLIDNFPTGTTINNLAPITLSGIQHTLVDNFPTGIAVNQVAGVVSVSGLVTNHPGVTMAVSGTLNGVTSASGVQNVHVDNYPTIQTVMERGVNRDGSGNWGVNVQNQVTTSGIASQPTWQQNTTAIKTIAGSISSAGMNTVVSGVANAYVKVFAYSLQTASTTAVSAEFADTNAVQAWRVDLQAITGTYFGANLAVDAPSYIFKTPTAGTGLAINLSASQSVIYSLSYWIDQSAI